VAAACRAAPEKLPAAAADTAAERPFADSVFELWIRGNDGSHPGDVLYVGQSSRLIASVVAVEKTADGRPGVSAREVAAGRTRWRSLTPAVVAVDSAGRVRALAPGAGRVEAAWSLAGAGAAGAADTMPFRVLAPDSAAVGPRFVEVSSAHTSDAYDTCGITAAGEVACVAFGADARAGGADAPGTGVLQAPAGSRFHGVATGFGFVCALDAEGRAFCWGRNEWGQLGRGGTGGADGAARPAATAARFERLSAGRDHACGVTAGGEVLCWGLGAGGALGPAGVDRCTVQVESRPHRLTPAPAPCARTPRSVPLPARAVEVAAGDAHTCALTAAGELYCWGDVYSIRFRAARPRRIGPPGVRLARVASGSRHVCGLDGQGALYCWGRNWFGQLGGASGRDGSPRLARVPDLPPLRAVTGGDEHTCGVARSGGAFCWGRNFNGQLGGGTWREDGLTAVAGGLEWSALAAGYGHTCGVTPAGVLYCWGSGLAFRREPSGYHEQPEPFAVSGWR
ncbi:MAG TPA: hypothetical protein VHG08_24730, partial [Longimicrobium sp.]|nr:hypothetical protein [Longimicrobium sp.]